MPYDVKPLSCEPKKLKGLSEKLIVSHWENNHGGAVRRLNAICAQHGEHPLGPRRAASSRPRAINDPTAPTRAFNSHEARRL